MIQNLIYKEISTIEDMKYFDELLPTIKITPKSNTPSITLFCYGGILEEVEIAVEKIFIEKEIFCDNLSYIDCINIQPLVELYFFNC